MKRTLTKLALLAAAALLAAPEVHAQRRVGSIYDPDRGPQNAIADKTARRAGDVLTILIRESTDVTNTESTDTKKESSLDYGLANFDIAPNAFSVLPGLTSDTASEFKGSANTQKSGDFTARVTVIVSDVLPNGNLVVSGRREIVVDDDTKLIEFTGIVRRYDVRANNTVESELVANAKITYRGMGPSTNATKRRGVNKFVVEAIDWLWPL